MSREAELSEVLTRLKRVEDALDLMFKPDGFWERHPAWNFWHQTKHTLLTVYGKLR